MSSTAIEESGAGAGEGAPTHLKTLFFLPSIDYLRVFESLLWTMLAAGHQVLVALEHNGGAIRPGNAPPLDAMRERYPRFDYRQLAPRKDLWLIPASAIRRRLDYLRYVEPEHPELAGDRAPQATWGMRTLLFLPPFRWSWGRRLLVRFLTRLEAGMPIPRAVRSFIKEQAPDVVIVSPLVESGSPQSDYIRAAEAAGIPSVVVVASGDDLTSKGGIRDVATLTVVRNEAEADEAVRLHGLPRERLVVVGAESSNGLHAPAVSGAVDAIERVGPTDVVRRREGRFLRPVLWLLTPLLVILLPLVRPIATARAVIRAVRRVPARIRKRARALRRDRKHKRGERRKVSAEAATEQKLARAEAKGQDKAQAEAARQQKLARAEAKQTDDETPAARPPGRIRTRTETLRRKRRERRKASVQAAKEQKLAQAEAAKEQKLARAQAKGQRKAPTEAAMQAEAATDTTKLGDEPPAEPTTEAEAEPTTEAENSRR